MTWDDLTMADKAKFMRLSILNGVSDLNAIRDTYNDAMMKGTLAREAHFGNPTALRIVNNDTRSYTFEDGTLGNVLLGSYGNYVIPGILDVNGKLEFIEDPLAPENKLRSTQLAIRFDRPKDAEYFAKNYKRIAPMMNLYPKEEDHDEGIIRMLKGVRIYKDGGDTKESINLSNQTTELLIRAGLLGGAGISTKSLNTPPSSSLRELTPEEYIKLEYTDAALFMQKYLQSPGFRERYLKFHPLGLYRTFKQGIVPIYPALDVSPSDYANDYYAPYKHLIHINSNPLLLDFLSKKSIEDGELYNIYNNYGYTEFPIDFTISHELGHFINRVLAHPSNYDYSSLGALHKFFNNNHYKLHSDFYPQLLPNKRDVNEHDALLDENYSDIMAFRRMLKKDGIYDSTKANTPFTMEHLIKAKKHYKNQFIRVFNSFTDDMIIKIMNTVAQNNTPVNPLNNLVT